MILFDYGQTLINEKPFDGVKGTEAVLKYATANKYNLNLFLLPASICIESQTKNWIKKKLKTSSENLFYCRRELLISITIRQPCGLANKTL